MAEITAGEKEKKGKKWALPLPNKGSHNVDGHNHAVSACG
jgi:hypothetical protein